MKHKIFLVVTMMLITSFMFYSCSKEEEIEIGSEREMHQNEAVVSRLEVQFERDDDSNEGKVILGKKRNNPFTVSNINQAKAIVYGTSVPNKITTHKYVKFKPTTQEHLNTLENWETYGDVPLFDFPLEYEIEREGDIYFDPSVADSIYTYQYASIPIGVNLPEVPYEIIDDLHIDKSDPLLLSTSFWLTDNKADINEYVFKGGLRPDKVNEYSNNVIVSLRIPNIPDEPCPNGYEWQLVFDDSQIGPAGESLYVWECRPAIPPPPPPTNACGCPIPSNWRSPAGCVKVDYDGTMKGVEIASIKVKDTWFTCDNTFTDQNGCWRVNKSYSGNVWM